MPNHYVYKIIKEDTKQYYIGVRSCAMDIENDSYMGSGMWIFEQKKIYGSLYKNKHLFKKEIIGIYANRQIANEMEKMHIKECRNDSLNMNLAITNRPIKVIYEEPKKRIYDRLLKKDFEMTLKELKEKVIYNEKHANMLFNGERMPKYHNRFCLYDNIDQLDENEVINTEMYDYDLEYFRNPIDIPNNVFDLVYNVLNNGLQNGNFYWNKVKEFVKDGIKIVNSYYDSVIIEMPLIFKEDNEKSIVNIVLLLKPHRKNSNGLWHEPGNVYVNGIVWNNLHGNIFSA